MTHPLLARPRRLGSALLLGALALAGCQAPAPAAAPTRAARDDFAVVRATAEAAFQGGQGALARGELEAALVQLDQARLNDPDDRADIRAALAETVRRLQELPPPPTRTPIPTPTPTPEVVAATPTPRRPGTPSAPAAPPAGFARWTDAQGRFTLAAPGDWQVRAAPPAAFGSGVVAFRDPTGRAEVVVAVDDEATVVSPELYAARMDLAMQRAPGYALESVFPGVLGNTPSLRRNFSVTQRSGATRGFQVAALRGTTPFILSASAPRAEYPAFERTLEQILGSFQFE